MIAVPGEEFAVDDFAMRLLCMMGQARGGQLVGIYAAATQKSLSLSVESGNMPILLYAAWILLVIQEDKCHIELRDTHLISEGIGEGQNNNRMQSLLGLDNLDFKEMARIIMIGSSLTCFKVPVTRSKLLQAVQRGHYPFTPTVVAIHWPSLPRPLRVCLRLITGVSYPLFFELFKQFVKCLVNFVWYSY